MSEAPKKIWINDDWGKHPYWHDKENRMTTTPYIRADLVDGLVEALEKGDYKPYCDCEECKKVRETIKALEEK